MLKDNPPEAFREGWSDAMVSRRTGTPRTPYSVYIKGKKWKDFENDDHARAVMDKLKAKFVADGRDPSVITIAPTDIPEGVAEEVDKAGALKAAQAAAKFMIRNLDDRAALKDYSMHFWSPTKFYQGATMAMRGVGYDEIVQHITQDRPAQFEQEQKPGFGEFPPKQEITIVPPKKLKSGETYQDRNKYWQSQGQAPIYKTNEDHADQVKRVFKDKSGKPVGEIGIDPESSPGNGEWYVHHYATGYSVVGFDSAAEAKRELLYVHKHPDSVEGHPSTKEQGVAEGQVSDNVSHRGDVDTTANIEVLGVDLNNDTFKITYNDKPYTIKIQYFSKEDLGRWQIPDYEIDVINAKGKNIIDLIDWDNWENDRRFNMVNTTIAYLDTQHAGDIQLMAWRQVGIENSTAEALYQEIQDFYKNNKQQIDKATAWLAQNIEDAEERQVFADFAKNPVSTPAKTKYVPKEYLMYVAFSYSREGNTEMTPGMNLPKIQLADPDDEEEYYRKVDELFRKVQFKFDAFEQKIIDLAWSEGLNAEPDQGVGFGQREMFWDFKSRTTEFSGLNKEMQQRRAKAILEFRAAVEKYVAAFNNTLIKIGLPGITNYSTWSGVLGDQLTDQQVRYFETPEGFANLASGKIDVAKMIDDNVAKQGVAEDAQWDTGDDVGHEEDDTTGTYYYKGWKFIETANDAYSGEAWLVEPDGDETWYGYEVDENHGIRKYYDKQGRHAFNLSAHDEGQSTEKWLKAHASDWGTTSLSQPKPYTMNEQGVAEGQTDYQKRRQRERDVDAGKPVARQPKNPQTDCAKKRAKDKRDMELGETTNYWIKLQNERNTKIASLVNELKENIEKNNG
jgi:hypothetical protein